MSNIQLGLDDGVTTILDIEPFVITLNEEDTAKAGQYEIRLIML